MTEKEKLIERILNNGNIELSGVREYNEEYPVVLGLCNNRLCVIARNEGGYNSTAIDLEDLLNSLDRMICSNR